MNEKEELKTAVIKSCINGTMTVKDAADRLNFSERYVKKLKSRFRKYGASSILHGNYGKQPKHTINADIKSKIIKKGYVQKNLKKENNQLIMKEEIIKITLNMQKVICLSIQHRDGYSL